jgi:hypothetical protein
MCASARTREDKIPIVRHAFQLTGRNKAGEVVESAELAIRKLPMSAEIGNELLDSAFKPVPLLLECLGNPVNSAPSDDRCSIKNAKRDQLYFMRRRIDRAASSTAIIRVLALLSIGKPLMLA